MIESASYILFQDLKLADSRLNIRESMPNLNVLVGPVHLISLKQHSASQITKSNVEKIGPDELNKIYSEADIEAITKDLNNKYNKISSHDLSNYVSGIKVNDMDHSTSRIVH